MYTTNHHLACYIDWIRKSDCSTSTNKDQFISLYEYDADLEAFPSLNFLCKICWNGSKRVWNMEIPVMKYKYKSWTGRSSLSAGKCQMKFLWDLNLKACTLVMARQCKWCLTWGAKYFVGTKWTFSWKRGRVDCLRKKRILPDLGHFGSPLADDAADELVGDGHLVGLLAVRRSPLSAQHGKGWRGFLPWRLSSWQP